MGAELAGYGPYLGRAADGVHDPLYATALVLEQDGERLALLALDLIGVSAPLTSIIRHAVEQQCQISGDRLMVACSHTHSGPATLFLRAWGEMAPDYLALLPRHLAGVVAAAAANLQAVEVQYGAAELPGVAANRADPNGPVHEAIELVVLAGAAQPVAALSAFGCHPVTRAATNTRYSRDFVGPLVDGVSTLLDGAPTLFLQGAAGDINPVKLHQDRTDEVSAELLRGAETALSRRQSAGAPHLGMASTTLDLPLAPPSHEALAALQEQAWTMIARETTGARQKGLFDLEAAAADLDRLENGAAEVRSTELQAIRLTDQLALAGVGAEVFATFGNRIRDESPFRQTLVVGYANDLVGYIPDEAEYDRDGYAAVVVPRILDQYPFSREVGTVLTDGMAALLREPFTPIRPAPATR
ncbi:MAG: hypothetical protein HUU35_12310 [Armatimonadetes bacterium]|nr:hypothetical protein [Armatimonadota bacterium]